jgi:DNA-binding NarL/FixJ family response regulator
VTRALIADIETVLASVDQPLELAAEVLREAFAVDRVSISRIDASAGRFEIAADAGAELLAPGTALPVSVCSYFARAAEGRSFHEEDFDASRTFGLPLDNVVLASGFHSGCSVPIRRSDTSIGVVSLSASTRRRDMDGLVVQLEAVADALAPGIERPAAACASRVLVCHADALAGRGIARLVERERGLSASVAPTLADALDAAASTPPDLLICGDWMGGLRVDEVARALRRAGVDAPLLVVSSRDTPENVRASRLAGASAHIARRDALSSLPAALDAVRDGRTVLPDTAGASTQLTAREQQLLENLEEGLRFKQVARRLGISEATAKTHARNLFRKLGATSRAEAVHAARDRGLLG